MLHCFPGTGVARSQQQSLKLTHHQCQPEGIHSRRTVIGKENQNRHAASFLGSEARERLSPQVTCKFEGVRRCSNAAVSGHIGKHVNRRKQLKPKEVYRNIYRIKTQNVRKELNKQAEPLACPLIDICIPAQGMGGSLVSTIRDTHSKLQLHRSTL